MKKLKNSLIDSLDALSAYPRIKQLCDYIKQPKHKIQIPETDHSQVALLILQVIQEVPTLLDDPNSVMLEELLINCASRRNAMDKMRKLVAKKPAELSALLDILEKNIPRTPVFRQRR
jgi:hypothetical protein